MYSIINLIGTSFLMYYFFYKPGSGIIDYKSPTFVVLSILIFVNLYSLIRHGREGFSNTSIYKVPRIIIDVSNLSAYADRHYIQTGNKIIWINNGKETKHIFGDEFISASIESGKQFEHVYNNPGIFRHYCSDAPEMVYTVEVATPDYDLPLSYYLPDGSSFSTEYYKQYENNILKSKYMYN